MSKLPDNDNHRNDIYENLPCQAMFNESVRKINKTTANNSLLMNNCNQNSHRSKHSAQLSTKEMLYATPLRKSDRYRSGERSRFHRTSGGSGGSSSIDIDKNEKLTNVMEYKLLNKDNKCRNGNPDDIDGSGGDVVDDAGTSASLTCANQLEDRRILNFLKDTTQIHKKMEILGSSRERDCPNASFSCLAREEHFANLVQQNFNIETPPFMVEESSTLNENDQKEPYLGEENDELPVAGEETVGNLEVFMHKKQSPDKEVNGIIAPAAAIIGIPPKPVYIHREWVLKKIALCLEQRNAGKKAIPGLLGAAAGAKSEIGATAYLSRSKVAGAASMYHGCLVLGSNGSGKTSICQAIMNGNSGTKGILNRKLLACYLINSQNPECHSLSLFIRKLVLQLLSHSSLIHKEESEKLIEDGLLFLKKEEQQMESKLDAAMNNISLEENAEEILIAELKRSVEQDEFRERRTSTSNVKKSMIRQKSAPSPEQHNQLHSAAGVKNSYSTHPPSTSGHKLNKENDKEASDGGSKASPGKKISKIPVAISARVVGSPSSSSKTNSNSIQQGGGEDIAEVGGDEMQHEIAAAINEDEQPEAEKRITTTEEEEEGNSNLIDFKEKPESQCEITLIIGENHTSEVASSSSIPPPLPKPKSCRTTIADGYYEMLISNPEIFECLNVDNIEKNPDECFKKALLFPLLELTPPKTALLLLIDSIDENYINEGNLISTLKGRCSTTQKSRNVAELLSNHIHLFPKWLFLVCTTKKQTKHITKMFTGFKKITLDDLRKSHVVKDVQEYIINRLNSDFKDSIMLTKEIIESLHQLYIKSNGCILYLEKVLNGIKENFFSFREIKLIPCTLNGLYLYICQKSFNKKQYLKIRPVLNILLASTGFVDKLFLFNCLRTHNYTIDVDEFEKRLQLMRNILLYDSGQRRVKIFHNSFCDWLVDVKFATKKFICDVNEGHVMISMYYMLISDTLCANSVRKFVYHLIKAGEYLTNRDINLDLILMLLESRINLNDCFYTNHLNCCSICESEFKNDANFLPKTRNMLEKFLNNELNEEYATFLCDFFKPSLPTDAKILKLLIETGINNADSQTSCDSSLMSPELSEKSQNIDFELADLLLSSEKSCLVETQRPTSPSEKSEPPHPDSQDDNNSTLHQLSDSNRIELHKGKALIHILANDGNHQLLERALNACKGPIDLEIEDYNGQTALNIASRNGHLDVVKLLLGFTQSSPEVTGHMKRVDVNHADHDGWTPLRSASWGGHTEVVKLLIGYTGCKIDLADKEGRTALRAAAWSGHEDILKILIEAGADVNSVDRQGRTSLIAASYMGHYDIVEILLENGADVNHLDLDGRSALCVAALCGSSGYSKVISTLLEHGANTDQLDNDGMSPLLVSSFEGNSEVCELLLENGADPDLADFMGRTPLWAACTAGHANVVKLLLFWGCGIDCMDSEGRTVLSIASAQGNVETVRQLLDRGLDETHRDNAGWTPLHYAAFEGFHDVCLQLLESGAKIDECDNEGKTALHLAAQEGRDKCVQCLLEIHCSFIDQKAHDGKTAFRLACIEGHLDCVQILLRFSCDVNSKDADSRTTLYILALENKLEVVKYLLDVTDVDVNIPDSEGRTALHVAAWQGHVDMVKLLITMGNADVNAMDLECRSPLHSCAWQGNHDVMGILLYFGAMADHACKQGATALGISAQEGHEKCVTILLKYGANPYKSDHCGRTPIKLAAKSNRSNILKIFEGYTKTDESNNIDPTKFHPSMLRSPDNPPPQGFLSHPTTNQQQQSSPAAIIGGNNSLMIPNNNNMQSPNILNASTSTHSSNNFYENTMQSDTSSLQKRKSVISSQSTGSSNEQAPLSFTQQLQRQTKLNSRNNPFVQNAPVVSSKYPKGHQRHSQLLPDLSEHQINMAASNDADMYDMECMSPLYATPPHSPSSELSSPGQLPSINAFEEIGGATSGNNHSTSAGGGGGSKSSSTDNHFARDTHMRIILGNLKDTSQSSSNNKSKRSGIATNPAMRMIRSRFDSAAQLIRRTNNMLSISSSNNQGSSSIGVKSGTFQWRKESQM
ncbi:ankyrin repeat domain-containing protein 50 isoform X1 [Episyrphus balteatus]|uniref:ankyrin repeat domain-containing protein 50 isoform X1 n=1 Tax=Episyrphus balteatus TaxID=286459 RepID=UPI0024857EB1|nr:ankyrin repeat domain-containing protein 50 isoform X1 [Episyrphus balteatus]XP_055853258.1 ankyrin repeat domain-containing protein 50 isoform X1 [Episyrphus balteatus]XP_055853259.1 ankyrin repeat domain-containing protein 50 isoform X1 [Episyrphus balteatus]